MVLRPQSKSVHFVLGCVGVRDEADDGAGGALHLSRECGSNDDILTMDVVVDSLPFFLYFNPEYIYAELRPILALAENKTHRADGTRPTPPLGHCAVGECFNCENLIAATPGRRSDPVSMRPHNQ